jgi:hypothetical protein
VEFTLVEAKGGAEVEGAKGGGGFSGEKSSHVFPLVLASHHCAHTMAIACFDDTLRAHSLLRAHNLISYLIRAIKIESEALG